MSIPIEKTRNCQLILALDIEERADAIELVRKTGERLEWVKIGLQMFTRYGPDYVKEVADLGKRIFLDLKLHDIPNTVAKAIASVSDLPIGMLTIHTCGGREMMEWAVRSQEDHKPDLQLLGVTVLTSMDDQGLADIGIGRPAAEQVSALTALAREAGMSGLVCSPHEACSVKSVHGDQFKLVTPGIRPAGADAGDQKRIMTPKLAAEHGSDYIVVGRPIYQAADPASVVAAIQSDLG
ncbi:MAG: orotidine-5'-phosphate decarboxylase [Opitutales bacterium TMED158]|nr:MAG: orotidine-5'-phosphate decarboxylase [Opitutales bacterium TMED158]